MPRYTPGESVVLFLGRSSSLGLRTTLGLGQGRFTQHGGTLQNEIANSGLFKGVDFGSKRMNDKEKFMITTPQGGVDTATFTTLVRRAVNEKWWDGPKLKPRPGAPRPFAQTPSRMHTEGGGSHE
jgi:hypothetical protein